VEKRGDVLLAYGGQRCYRLLKTPTPVTFWCFYGCCKLFTYDLER